MKLFAIALCAVLSLPLFTADAAVTLIHHYQAGEDGATPLDSVGSADFTGVTGAAPTVVTGASGAMGSTSYLLYDAGSYSTGAALGSVSTNNYAVAGWFRVDGIISGDPRTDVTTFRAGPGTGSRRVDFNLSVGTPDNGDTDAWASSISGFAWVGNARGTEDSATAGTWVHLAHIRDNGTARFYIDGVQQTGTTTQNANWDDNATLGSLGGTSTQDIAVDDLRVYTFAAGEGLDALAASMAAVPEPSSTALVGLAGMVMLLRRRR